MTNLQELSKGHKGCLRCEGVGSYVFHGVKIFCESCHDIEKITAMYALMDSHFPKPDTKPENKTWEKNAEMLGFADAQKVLNTKPMTKI